MAKSRIPKNAAPDALADAVSIASDPRTKSPIPLFDDLTMRILAAEERTARLEAAARRLREAYENLPRGSAHPPVTSPSLPAEGQRPEFRLIEGAFPANVIVLNDRRKPLMSDAK